MTAKNLDDIADYVRSIKFKKKLIGGVDEISVWEEIDRLNEQYRSVILAQENKYRALLEERDDAIRRLRQNGG